LKLPKKCRKTIGYLNLAAAHKGDVH